MHVLPLVAGLVFKRAPNHTALLRKETYKDKASYASLPPCMYSSIYERWGAGVETQKNVRGEIGGWGRVPFNEPYAPLLSTIYDGA